MSTAEQKITLTVQGASATSVQGNTVTLMVPAPVPAPPTKTGLIVPLYIYPVPGAWDALVQAHLANPGVPVIAVVNPNDGPGSSVDPSYTGGINYLKTNGIKVLGYVHTSWDQRPLAQVEADVTAWDRLYPGLDGIFFDEESTDAGSAAYYLTLASFARSAGYKITVGNPGTEESAPLEGIFDLLVEWEEPGFPPSVSAGDAYIATAVAVLPSDPSKLYLGVASYVYVTDEPDPPSYARFPSYLSQLMQVLG